jgi:transposase InsO family protein
LPPWICSWFQPSASDWCMALSSCGFIAEISYGSMSQPTRQRSGLHARSPSISLGRGSPLYNPGPRSDLRRVVARRLRAVGIRDKPIAPASPWQNGFAERTIGSIRRECLEHIIVFGEAHLRRNLISYAAYYNSVRTHRSLHEDAPVSRPVQPAGSIKSHPTLGGLHHHYVRVWVFGTHRD